MFIRISGRKGFEYVYVVASVREGKNIKQKIIKKLGKLSDIIKDDPNALDKLKAKYKDLTADSIEEKTQKAAEETVERYRDALRVADEIRNQDESPLPLLCYGLEPLRVLWNRELNLGRCIANLQYYNSKCEFDLNRAIFYLTGTKVLDPSSISDSYASRVRYLSQPLKDIYRNDLYTTLSFLSQHKDTIIRNINRSTADVVKRNDTMIFYDVSNTYFETSLTDEERLRIDEHEDVQAEIKTLIKKYCKEQGYSLPDDANESKNKDELDVAIRAPFVNEDGEILYDLIPDDLMESIRKKIFLRMRGLSKEHRYDLPLISIALVIDENGIPLDYEIYSGCSSEYHTMEKSIKKLKTKFNVSNLVVCADRGLNSVSNLDMLKNMGFGFLVAQKVTNLPNTFQQYMTVAENTDSQDEEYSEWYGVNGISKQQYRYRVFDNFVKTLKRSEADGGDLKVSCKLVLSFSYERYKRDIAVLERDRAKALKAISEKKTIVKQASGWKQLVEVKEHGALTANSFKDDLYQKRLRLCGYAAVVYSDAPNAEHKLDNEELGLAYHRQVKIKDCFRVLKTNIQLRPFYVYTPEHIRGHVMICFLALVLFRLMEYRLKEAGTPMSINAISNTLNDAHVVATKIKDEVYFLHVNSYCTESRKINQEQIRNFTDEQYSLGNTATGISQIMKAVGLKPLRRTNTFRDLNSYLSRKFSSHLDLIPGELHNLI
ncbi:MAG: IS1634 family transposase [Succinivibrio sp.]|nr:IS1634 family transposase [Succinivibrio sp.]